MMENNYIFLLTLVGLSFQYEWLAHRQRRALLIGSAAFGLNLLTRLTTGLDLMAGALFLLLVLFHEAKACGRLWEKCRSYVAIAPVYAVFGLIDRVYQYHRFGSFFNTYVSVFASEARERDPSLPPNYPFETPFHEGFFGALFAPEKSIFLFDPLLILMLLLIVLRVEALQSGGEGLRGTRLRMLFAYISFYARYTVWSGDFAWGDRYVSTAAELVACWPCRCCCAIAPTGQRALWTGIALIVVQRASRLLRLPSGCRFEIYQMETLGHPTFVIALRLKNIVAFALGKMDAWGLNTDAMIEDPWDYVHITTWNFFPFLLRRVGVAPGWVVNIAFAVWTAGVAAFVATMWRLRRVIASLRAD